MTTTDDRHAAGAVASRFDSLGEIIRAQANLFQTTSEPAANTEEGGDMDVELVREFLRRTARTGVALDDPGERKQAQGIIDYWSAALYRQVRAATDRLTSAETILVDFDPAELEEAIQQANAILESFSAEDLRLARDILLSTTRPTQSGFELEPVSVERLRAYGDSQRVDKILQQLERTGILKRITNGTDPSARVVLASESYARVWPRLRAWLEHRRQLHDAAVIWQQRNRSTDALLEGQLLKEAQSNRDLSDLEREFIEASRHRRDALQRRSIAALTACSLVLGAFALVATFLALKLNSANSNLVTAHETLQRTNTKLEEIVREEKDAREAAEENARMLRSEREQASATRDGMVRQLADLESKIDSVLSDASGDNPRLDLLREAQSYLHEYQGALVSHAANGSDQHTHVYPGAFIGPGEGYVYGTASFVVTDRHGRRFLAAPQFVLHDDAASGEIFQFRAIGGERKKEKRLGRIHEFRIGKISAVSDLGFVELAEDVKATNEIPNYGKIHGFAEDVAPEMPVVMFGAASGKKTGRVLEVKEDGTIITERISRPGDAGAPVLTENGLLIGVLISSDGKGESVIKPVSTTIGQLGLTLLSDD